jgi:hypothetical protein
MIWIRNIEITYKTNMFIEKAYKHNCLLIIYLTAPGQGCFRANGI